MPIRLPRKHGTSCEAGRQARESPNGPALIPFAESRYFGNNTLLTTWMTPFDWLTSAIVTRASPPDSSMM